MFFCRNGVASEQEPGWKKNKNLAELPPFKLVDMGVSKNNGIPQIIHFNRVFHCKPSILGENTPIFGNTHIFSNRNEVHWHQSCSFQSRPQCRNRWKWRFNRHLSSTRLQKTISLQRNEKLLDVRWLCIFTFWTVQKGRHFNVFKVIIMKSAEKTPFSQVRIR